MSPHLLHYADVECAYDWPERIGRLAGTVDEHRTEETLVVGAGDVLGPGVLATEFDGEQALEFFEAVSPDVSTFGNHDFDFGLATVRRVVRSAPQEWVAANLEIEGVDLPDSTVVTRDGDRIGVVGVTDTTAIGDWHDDLTQSDPVPAARTAVEELRDEVEYVVVLAHLGDDDVTTLARETAVDVVCAAHVHSERWDRLGDTLVLRPGSNGQVVCSADLRAGTTTRLAVRDGPRDDRVTATFEDRLARVGLADVVARTADPIERTREARYAGRSPVGSLVAEAFRWAGNADAGCVDTGGLRDGPPLVGDVVEADVRGLYPFDAPVEVVQIRGSDVRALVEEAFRPDRPDDRTVWAHFAGVDVEWSPENGVRSVSVGGRDLAPSESYEVAAGAFVVGHDTFEAIDSSDVVRSPGSQPDVLVDYARDVGLSSLPGPWLGDGAN